MSKRNSRDLWRLLSIAIASAVFVFGGVAMAQDDEEEVPMVSVMVVEDGAIVEMEVAEEELAAFMEENTVLATMGDAMAASEEAATVQGNVDYIWLLLCGFLVFFMQAGFATLEAGFIRQTGVVNSLTENFVDAGVTGVLWWAIGFGVAYGSTVGGLFGASNFFFSGLDSSGAYTDPALYRDFFFQFAFAAAASTIATGGMAERTNFVGKIIYSALVGAIIYPVVVHWIWAGDGWLFGPGYNDFAGSAIVHMTGGILALIGAIFLGPRKGVDPKNPPRPHNLALATIGTSILWFGWYGFNVGSTLAASDQGLMGLVATNTTIAAAAGSVTALFFVYFTKGGKWDLSYSLNGSLAGLVGITASCGFVAPWASLLIGITSGVVLVISQDVVANAGIDDAVGAFAVHGACGMVGVLSIGFFGIPTLTWSGTAGLFYGGGLGLLWFQFWGMLAVIAWVTVTAVVMFGALKAMGLLRISESGEDMGIDVYEHGATVWPDVLDIDAEKGSVAAGD
ncbi:MAG: ammonium transporter [Chloroflexota bacterium]